MRSMEIRDRYEGLLAGTRSAVSRHFLSRIVEQAAKIEENAKNNLSDGTYVVIPELVPETWGNRYVGDCIKEYSITTRLQAEEGIDFFELEVTWDASREDFKDLWGALDKVTRKIDFKKYCRKLDDIDLG